MTWAWVGRRPSQRQHPMRRQSPRQRQQPMPSHLQKQHQRQSLRQRPRRPACRHHTCRRHTCRHQTCFHHTWLHRTCTCRRRRCRRGSSTGVGSRRGQAWRLTPACHPMAACHSGCQCRRPRGPHSTSSRLRRTLHSLARRRRSRCRHSSRSSSRSSRSSRAVQAACRPTCPRHQRRLARRATAPAATCLQRKQSLHSSRCWQRRGCTLSHGEGVVLLICGLFMSAIPDFGSCNKGDMCVCLDACYFNPASPVCCCACCAAHRRYERELPKLQGDKRFKVGAGGTLGVGWMGCLGGPLASTESIYSALAEHHGRWQKQQKQPTHTAIANPSHRPAAVHPLCH